GLVTMVMAAWIGMFRDDLKSLLAFSTVSHLGLITMLLGFGTEAAAVAAVFHIINHATFKAALFMTAGIIDHEAGTRSILRLGGLRKLMPITFVIGTIAALSMAGVAPLNGFLSKELMLEEATHAVWRGNPSIIYVMATIGAMFSVCYPLRFIWQVFFGPERDDYPHHPHDPGFGMWVGPGLLVVLVVLIGLMPNTMAGWLVEVSAGAVTGAQQHPHFALWHGVTLALKLSVIALLGGTVLLMLNHRMIAIRDMVWRPDGKRAFDAMTRASTCTAGWITARLTNGSMSRALAALSLTIVLCGLWAFSTGGYQGATRPMLDIAPVAFIGWLLLIVATGCMVTFHRLRI
ncbi:MAG TPA: proton-conducting transporter membrane subunit, partial [Paracoccus sp. (in: a-proteobacteria)]|nr:proton-conducting transporter membrane subunit [Paracoccus sp. (in: a-proteobacteria)]